MDCRLVMKMLTKITITIVIVVYIVSTFLILFLNHMNTDHDFRPSHDIHREFIAAEDSTHSSARQSVSGADPNIYKDPIVIDDQMKHTFWFLQISDLHISIHFDPKRAPDLEQFCREYIDIMKPSVVVATGDLTDARTKSPMGSQVHEEEWIMYWNVLNKTNVRSRTAWLDIKGNHDNFNVYDWNSRNNFFNKYSIRGPNTTRSYKYSVKHDTETYNFIGVDACLEPSPKRPFNFIGLLKDSDMKRIRQMKSEAQKERSNYTIWFGHYPTSSIAMPSPGLRELINGPYLCGHYHTVGGLVQHMYSTQPTGYLEIELSDWKDMRTIRLGAIDHGLFTFIDFKFNDWPVILVTNPKNSLFSMPNIEPWHRIANSTHIRALVFSNRPLSSVEFRIDDSDHWRQMRHISGPLYVHEWQPNQYSSGLHWIEVTASDTDDNRKTVRHQFSLDKSKGDFTFGARLMLRINNRSLGYFLFGLAVSICVIPLIVLRILPSNRSKNIIELAESNTSRQFIFKLYLLSNLNSIFIPLIAIPLYATLGPWFVGYVLDDYIGICFVWGMIIDGTYLPGGITYILGTLVLILLHMPITCCLAHIIYCRRQQLCITNSTSFVTTYCHLRHLFFIFFVLCHFLFSLNFYFAYGLMTYVLGFFNTWSYVVYILLWNHTLGLSAHSFPESIRPKYRKTKELDQLVAHDSAAGLTRSPIRK